eukprot:g47261.t1
MVALTIIVRGVNTTNQKVRKTYFCVPEQKTLCTSVIYGLFFDKVQVDSVRDNMANLVLSVFVSVVGAEMVQNWVSRLESHPTAPDTHYRVVFEWDHLQNETIFVDGQNGGRVYNADDDVRCNGGSSVKARDGLPYWMPRFFPRPVSPEITQATGVRFASVDWQPCGHKEITICHAESHYDFHLYYDTEAEMSALPMCDIGTPTNPDLPVCPDSATNMVNHDYFRLINHSIPTSYRASSSSGGFIQKQPNFCVDASSAILRSGVHYGDTSETLTEWKTPVTIVGSHDCELKFFEPMFSWKWVSGCVTSPTTSPWPKYEVKDIQYTHKGIESLPDGWSVEVSAGCRARNCFPTLMVPPEGNVCHIKLTVDGARCPVGGCSLLRECGTMKDCKTGTPAPTTSSTSSQQPSSMVHNWTAYLAPHPSNPDTHYRLVFEWTHLQDKAIFVDGQDGGRVYNADDDVRCNGGSSVKARDGLPYWMPRFFPRPVSPEITQVTGVRFASVDWQPCGHKEITICHAESHYDFHLYYDTEAEMSALPMCDIGTPTNPDLPVCPDSATIMVNHDYFRLINHSIPTSYRASSSSGGFIQKQPNFCVDASSAILRSGVHYGDTNETLTEWKTPVTIVGSHDCELKFFEPMFSWKWVSGCVTSPATSPWPRYEVKDIQYTRKGIESLPDGWSVEVSEGCRARNCFPTMMVPPEGNECQIKLTVEGERCPAGGCSRLQECGTMKDCKTGSTYVSPAATGPSTTTTTPPTTTNPASTTAPGASTTTADASSMVQNWTAYLAPHPSNPGTHYRLVFEWSHLQDKAIYVDGQDGGRVYNAEDDARCNGDSSVVARDGLPYWMPRFFPRAVSTEITQVTGVRFASADWQPCGHKEITICHAESHYDFHLYYESEEDMNALPKCDIGTPTNPTLPVCRDSDTNMANHDYFLLINHSIPTSYRVSASSGAEGFMGKYIDKTPNFCVDASSAILRSGVHYGDTSETLAEWTTPVTIVGSHACELKFFEPMFSWKWVSGCVDSPASSWPRYEVKNITYTRKGIQSLPDGWSVEVSEGCRASSCTPTMMVPPEGNVCHIKLTVDGERCPKGGCLLLHECGAMKDCKTGKTYVMNEDSLLSGTKPDSVTESSKSEVEEMPWWGWLIVALIIAVSICIVCVCVVSFSMLRKLRADKSAKVMPAVHDPQEGKETASLDVNSGDFDNLDRKHQPDESAMAGFDKEPSV